MESPFNFKKGGVIRYHLTAEKVPDGAFVSFHDYEILRSRIESMRAIVDEQAIDAGLWFFPHTAPEAYLQQQLRRLHEVIEAA